MTSSKETVKLTHDQINVIVDELIKTEQLFGENRYKDEWVKACDNATGILYNTLKLLDLPTGNSKVDQGIFPIKFINWIGENYSYRLGGKWLSKLLSDLPGTDGHTVPELYGIWLTEPTSEAKGE